MKQSTMEAYAEVDSILNLMESKYVLEIPKQLREMFKTKKATNYNKKIVANKPLQEQNLNTETLEILAVLNYNYWCKDEKKKKELLDLYYNNELKQEQELREKYNPDNLFKKDPIQDEAVDPINNNEMQMIEYKGENIISKFFNKIKSYFEKFFKSRKD